MAARSPREVAEAIMRLLFDEKEIAMKASEETYLKDDPKPFRNMLTAMIEGEIRKTYIDF